MFNNIIQNQQDYYSDLLKPLEVYIELVVNSEMIDDYNNSDVVEDLRRTIGEDELLRIWNIIKSPNTSTNDAISLEREMLLWQQFWQSKTVYQQQEIVNELIKGSKRLQGLFFGALPTITIHEQERILTIFLGTIPVEEYKFAQDTERNFIWHFLERPKLNSLGLNTAFAKFSAAVGSEFLTTIPVAEPLAAPLEDLSFRSTSTEFVLENRNPSADGKLREVGQIKSSNSLDIVENAANSKQRNYLPAAFLGKEIADLENERLRGQYNRQIRTNTTQEKRELTGRQVAANASLVANQPLGLPGQLRTQVQVSAGRQSSTKKPIKWLKYAFVGTGLAGGGLVTGLPLLNLIY